jgi:hypothetical protein
VSIVTPLATIPLGVVVERSKGVNRWSDFLWRPVALLTGVPDTPPWSKLSDDGERATFYAGAHEVELYRSETTNYRDNLATDAPLLWIVLNPADADPPFTLANVTADPAEGEGLAGIPGVIVESLPMPDMVRDLVAAFVAEHHVEREFNKRRRDRADPEALGRRLPQRHEDEP